MTEYNGQAPENEELLKKPNKDPRIKLLVLAEILAMVIVILVVGRAMDRKDDEKPQTDPGSSAASAESQSGDPSSGEESSSAVPASVDISVPTTESEAKTGTEPLTEPVSQTESVTESDHETGLKELKKTIEDKFATFDGTWCCYMKDLSSGNWFVINDHIVYPASMIKLFALGACYQQINDGLVDENEMYSTLVSMAALSNNQAFNMVVWKIGKTYINEWCHSQGYNDTAQFHGLNPSTNAEGLTTDYNRSNQTSPMDVGHMLESIYRGECVSEYASQKMLDILFQQKYRGKIPSALPYAAKVANKTGDTFNVSHDAAIVYSPGGDYILVIMAEVPEISFQQHYRFFDVSKTVYEFFNPGTYDTE